jgi:uncharacterized protein (DUF362 family)
MSRKMNRREFIVKGSSVVIGAGLAANAGPVFGRPAGDAGTGRVIEVAGPGAVLADRRVDATVARKMLRRGMEKLTGSPNPWAKFLSPSDRVGLKINTLGRPLLYTHHELIAAMVAELTEFGVRENSIIVWDRFETQMRDCKFTFNTSENGVRVYGTDSLDEYVRRYDPDVAYVSDFDNPEQRQDGSTASRLSSVFTRECDKVINMAILKDHGMSGVTLTLKNLAYGLCDNNRRFHGPKHIGPFISDFCARPDVRKKVVLHVVDGLEACYDLGPCPKNPKVIYAAETLWLGTDPVALDAVGRAAIDAKREQAGLLPIRETGRAWDHIELAARKGVGVADLDKIRIERIGLG